MRMTELKLPGDITQKVESWVEHNTWDLEGPTVELEISSELLMEAYDRVIAEDPDIPPSRIEEALLVDITMYNYEDGIWEEVQGHKRYEEEYLLDEFQKSDLRETCLEELRKLGEDDWESELDALAEDCLDEVVGVRVHESYTVKPKGGFPDLNVVVSVWSNYDCCNSYEDPEDLEDEETYRADAWKVVQSCVKKEDFVHAFREGVYGGSVFTFLDTVSLAKFHELSQSMNSGNPEKYKLRVAAGTPVGFYSSFQGSSGSYQETTFQDAEIPVNHGPTSYDVLGIHVDEWEGRHSLSNIFGGFPIEGNGEHFQIIEVSDEKA